MSRCKRMSPLVRTAVPVDGRFEHIVLSCNITSDHAIIWILQESEKALDVSFIICNWSEDCDFFCSTTSSTFPVIIMAAAKVFRLLLVQCMINKERVMGIPPTQKMERQASIAKEHREEYQAALLRAVALDIPHARSPSYGTFRETEEGENLSTPPSYGTFRDMEEGENSSTPRDSLFAWFRKA